MRKTFPLQVWQTAGLILGSPRSHTASNLHTDYVTSSRDVNAAGNVLFTCQRLLERRHPLRTVSPSKSPYFIRSARYAGPLHKEGKTQQLNPKPAVTGSSDAPTVSAIRPDCSTRRRHMHHKKPAQTIKCVNTYTNASFLYVRSTL